MAFQPPSGTEDGELFQSLVRGERGRALRAQLAARYPDCSADAIDDAIQFACRCFLDEAEGIDAPGQIYSWIRTAAHRNLVREAERRHREVAVDPIEDGLDRFPAGRRRSDGSCPREETARQRRG
jgi:DNA-directed RNA polymerase specialized sigma24 family protein